MQDGYDWQGYLAPRHRKYLDRENTEYQIKDHSNKSQFHGEIRNRAEGARRDNALICDGIRQGIVPPEILQESNKRRISQSLMSEGMTDEAIEQHIKAAKAQGHSVGLGGFEGIEEMFEEYGPVAEDAEGFFVSAVIQAMQNLSSSVGAGPPEKEACLGILEEHWPDTDEVGEVAEEKLFE